MNKQAMNRMKTIVAKKGSLADVAPHLVSEWDFSKNEGFSPSDFPAGSNKEAFWLCSVCGNSYCMRINLRFRGAACPQCAPQRKRETILKKRGSFAETYPELLLEWDYEKNACNPTEITKGSNEKFWWKCKEGHSWQATPPTRIKGHGCPFCSGRYVLPENSLLARSPELAMEWHPTKNGSLTPDMVAPFSSLKVWWCCRRGHEWQATVNNRFQGRGCAQCSAELKSSFPEQAIIYYLSQVFCVESRSRINGWEIDILLPDFNIGIEYDGVVYHSKDYLVERENRKTKDIAASGIDLIRVKESYEREGIIDSTVYFFVDTAYKRFPNAIKMLFSVLEQKTGVVIDIPVDIENDRIDIMAQYTLICSARGRAEWQNS